MGDRTKIEWSDATWNPVTGCTKVSAGCDHCYAETIAHRFAGTAAYPDGFDVTLRPERLRIPLRWTRPRLVFVNSMSDLFHADVPTDYIAQVFGVMGARPQHTFQVLTKRPARMRSLLRSDAFRDQAAHFGGQMVEDGDLVHDQIWTGWPLRNVWVGVSAEDQKTADLRIPVLMDTPAAVRFVSAEPLLGALRLDMSAALPDWVIVGGESGPRARPMDEVSVMNLLYDCLSVGVPFFFKQWGEHDADGVRVGKKAAGRVLRGQTWDEWPRGSAR